HLLAVEEGMERTGERLAPGEESNPHRGIDEDKPLKLSYGASGENSHDAAGRHARLAPCRGARANADARSDGSMPRAPGEPSRCRSTLHRRAWLARASDRPCAWSSSS